MSPSGARRVPAWALAVFLLALAARLAFWLVSDQPLLYRHQYTYLHNALRIAERADALRYVLLSDEWRAWMGWTIAPLYYVFEAALFLAFGPHLASLRFAQCLLGARDRRRRRQPGPRSRRAARRVGGRRVRPVCLFGRAALLDA